MPQEQSAITIGTHDNVVCKFMNFYDRRNGVPFLTVKFSKLQIISFGLTYAMFDHCNYKQNNWMQDVGTKGEHDDAYGAAVLTKCRISSTRILKIKKNTNEDNHRQWKKENHI